MDVDYCLTCQCHFEAGPFNPYCSIQCRPASSNHHHHLVADNDDAYDDDDEPVYHYVQDTSYIRQWAAAIPDGSLPHDNNDDDCHPSIPSRRQSPSPHRSRSRPKLLTSLSKPPTSTTSSSFHHADVLSSSPSSDSSSLATPVSPALSSKMLGMVKSWVSPSSVHDNVWWTPQSTSQQCHTFLANTDSHHHHHDSPSSPSKPMTISTTKKSKSHHHHSLAAYEASYLPQPRYIPSRGGL
ncbi:hypothetical protein E1B28_007508 [Marasmius oreades]|uniref:Uncharacterized protein n=1 Tax=Marasmius oreades TaxID=181124 RepID=A0A9P7S236_9AGAR|nr:uncharacterized protein E1B28_007508 [Marasmius oreades]KAG7093870.1 hypothetical protein E1B28_007508 [Marasmius oreades]